MSQSHNKVTIIGAGMVGSTTAYSLVLQDIAEEIALIDINEKLVASQVMDLQHAVPFAGATTVKVGTYADCADSSVVVITCGAAQKPGETRLDLVQKNAAIMKEILPQVFDANPDAVVVMVTNPVDVLTYLAVHMYPEKKFQIMGTGTILDSARLRHLIGEEMKINPKSIHAYMIGEHGDSEFALWSTAAIGNMRLGTCEELSTEEKERLASRARNAAYTIIEGKQSTYYAIGAGAAHLIEAILYNKRTVLPVSHIMEGEYGVSDICLSLPAVVGRGGILGKLCIHLSDDEAHKLRASADILKDVAARVL